MTIPKFDNRAKNALAIAQQVAQELRHNYIGSEHLLYGILSQPQNDLPFQMAFIDGMSNQELLEIIRRIGFENGSNAKNNLQDGEYIIPDITEELQLCLDKSIKIAESFNFPYVGLEHLVFGILDTENSNGQKLMNLNSENIKKIKEILYSVFENYKRGVRTGEKNFKPKFNKRDSVLEFFTTNLNKKISNEPNFEIIEREQEIDRIIQILSRKNKNNPILLGVPGVGKTALVEGLAKRINMKKVPDWLVDKQILSLDLGNLIAGTMFRGEFESRIKAILEEIVESKDVILFIDEIHSVIGAGNSSQGGPDLSSILKPALSRGEISVIGATTRDEYRTIVKKDKAFERRFQSINLDEPDHNQVINILRGAKVMYENYHHALFPDELLPELVTLTDRFLPERHFPDKALDILDETLVRCRILNMEKANLDKEKEKSWVGLEKQILDLIKQKNEAILEQNFELSKKFEEEQKNLEQELAKLNLPEKNKKPTALVTKEVLEKTISEVSGVPLVRVSSNIFTQIKNLQNALDNQIFGQTEATSNISSTLKRAYAGVNPNKGPIASFMLLGPTGVGKTELVKVITKELYGDPEKYLLKLDMSEFGEKHTVSRLLGSPAGYVGYEDAPQLTEFLRNKPYSVILFDEIEKGSKEILNILLQMLEDGRITDAKGETVSVEHALVFLTSNLGRNQLNKFASKLGFIDFTAQEEEDYSQIKSQVMEVVEKTIKPEVLGRINSKIVFRPIGKSVLKQIVQKELSILQNHLLKNGRTVSFKDEVIDYVCSKAAEKLEYGAREVKALVAEHVQDYIAEFILDNPSILNIEVIVSKNKDKVNVKEKKTKKDISIIEKQLDEEKVS
jgi:ATP-dependent Clp protease ATP-binding subunit ClpC